MAYFLFKCWREKLFRATPSDISLVEPRISFNLVPISETNAWLVDELRGKEYVEQFKRQLALGDKGYYAWIDNKPIGYGWIKHPGSDDYFFIIGEGCVYLCRFFVQTNYRGNRVYPSMINRLIATISDHDRQTYYIAVERGNEASERGLRKTGFSFVKEYTFIRGFKKTLNKRKLDIC